MLYTVAEMLARNLMREFKLAPDWEFDWNQNKRRLGVCKYRSKVIELSRPYVVANRADHVENTIRHEIAHALAGVGHGHGVKWKRLAIICGATPKSCSNDNEVIPGPWIAVCPGCASVFYRYRDPNKRRMRYCIKCGSVAGRLQFVQNSTLG